MAGDGTPPGSSASAAAAPAAPDTPPAPPLQPLAAAPGAAPAPTAAVAQPRPLQLSPVPVPTQADVQASQHAPVLLCYDAAAMPEQAAAAPGGLWSPLPINNWESIPVETDLFSGKVGWAAHLDHAPRRS